MATGRDWDIQGLAVACSYPALIGRTSARIEGGLVDAAKKYRAVFFKDVLRAIAVMDVPVDDRHFVAAAFGPQVVRGHRRIIEEAKAHNLLDFGVMARRPHAAKGMVGVAGE